MLKQTVYPIVFLILLVLFLMMFGASERTFSPVFQKCVDQREHNGGTDATGYRPAGLGRMFVAYVGCSGEFVDSHGSGISALATLIIAAFTGTLWVATSRQARLTQEALVADKRAFIFADGFMAFWIPDPVLPNVYNWRLRPRWRNTGGTPTKNLRSHVECEIRNSVLPSGYAFTPENASVGKGIIPPKADQFGGEAPPGSVTPQDILDAQAFKKFIYLWGWVRYFDVFPDTLEHVTHFCWLITVVGDPQTFIPNTLGQPPTPGTLTFNNLQHSEGNYTDET